MTNDNQSGGIVVSDNEQGNKLHSAKTGRFVGRNGEPGEMDSTERSALISKVVQKSIESGKFGNRILNTYNKADDEGKKSLISAIAFQLNHEMEEKEKNNDDRDVNKYNPISKIDTQGLDTYQRKTALLQDTRLSKSAILNATDEELDELLEAQYLFFTKNKQITESQELNDLKSTPGAVVSNIWMTPMTLDDYENLKVGGRIDKKLYYFENDYTGDDKDAKIQELTDYINLGEKYISILKAQDLDTSKDEAIMNKFSNPNSPYSWKRKHKDAVYIDNMKSSSEALKETNKIFGAETNKLSTQIFKSFGQDGLDLIADYTHGFVWANDPLRRNHFSATGASIIGARRAADWYNNIKKATDILDSCSYNEDIWVTRGTNYLGDPQHGINLNSIKNINDLVGMVFADEGFVSTSASKINYVKGNNSNVPSQAKMFSGHNIIQHIYAPSGTHMLHTASLATSNHTSKIASGQDNTDYSSQNEFLIQRGYSYRITKAYKLNNQIHVDCEVILGSDRQKYDDNELKKIERTYVN